MLPDRSEHPCQVSQLCVDQAVFGATVVPPPGLAIVAYIDGIGRVEGRCEGPAGSGFAMRFTHSGVRRDRFEKRLRWLINAKAGVNGGDQRRSGRTEPNDRVSQLALSDGRTCSCEVIDISLTGAAVKTEILPTVGSHVMLGKMRGRVVRHIEHGVAIEFVRPLERAPPVGGIA
jgi:hypothetical protein